MTSCKIPPTRKVHHRFTDKDESIIFRLYKKTPVCTRSLPFLFPTLALSRSGFMSISQVHFHEPPLLKLLIVLIKRICQQISKLYHHVLLYILAKRWAKE